MMKIYLVFEKKKKVLEILCQLAKKVSRISATFEIDHCISQTL